MAPQAQIDAANVSIEAAKTAGADRYAPESFNAASEALKTALTAVEEQNSKFALFRNYDASKTTLASVATLSTKAVEETTAKKEALKAEVNQATVDLGAIIVADKELLAKAPKGKEGKAALEAIGQEIAVVETVNTEVTAGVANNEDILTLSDKIKPAVEKAKAINSELTDVIAKPKGYRNPISQTKKEDEAFLDQDSLEIADSIAASTMPHFPWPPPKASTTVKIPRNLIVKSNPNILLSEIAKQFESILGKAGYDQISYYYFPSGFAIVSQLEQINKDGTPKSEESRWNNKYEKPKVFNLESYIRALFTAQPGYFRVIAFIFTSKPFNQSDKTITKETGDFLIHAGSTVLPKKIFDIPFSSDYYCMALIYEFKQVTINDRPTLVDPSTVSGKTHLVNTKIWKELEK